MQLSVPHVFECDCGAVRHSTRAALPVGWSTGRGMVWCTDCTTAGVPQRFYRQRGGNGQGKGRRAA